ncbi:hypothetical protein [Silvimonas sp.]|uniref:hypothetical protein n=1 Tax=Silvimonas sp. TaxID=2650811 RepID=UPI00283F3CE9|nr:hypothetical protein [Silvimonas sp.]MDR3430151.1 hypothetical protein [Silvimonas sp.]
MTKHFLIAAMAAAALTLGSAASYADDDHNDHHQSHEQDQHHGHDDDHPDQGHHDQGHAHHAPPPQQDRHWASRDDWRRAHAKHLKGKYFDDWRTGYRYQPGQYVWYNGRAYEPARPLSEAEVRMTPNLGSGIWLDVTASIPLN